MAELVSTEKYPFLSGGIQSHYECLLGTLPGVVYTLNEKGEFTFIGEGAGPILGFTRNDLVGKHFSYIVHPGDIPSVSREHLLPRFEGVPTGSERAPKLFDERRSWPRRTSGLQVRLQRNAAINKKGPGEVVACKVNASGQYNSNNRFCGTVGVIYDMVEEGGGGFTFANAKKYNAFDLLTHALSHVFSNVFTGIYGNLQLIEMQMENASEFSDNIDAIKHSIENAISLVKKLSGTISKQADSESCSLESTLHNEAIERFGSPAVFYIKTSDNLWKPQIDSDYTRHIVRAVYFHIAQSMHPDGTLAINAVNLAEAPVKLPRIDCTYLKVEFSYPETGSTDASESREEEATTLERIASMALSFELLKKVGGLLTLTNRGAISKITLYIPALPSAH